MGLIPPIKPLKNTGQVLLFDSHTGVVHAQNPSVAPGQQRNGHRSAVIGIFQGVVDQNYRHLLQHFLIAIVLEIRRHVRGQGLSSLESHALKGERHTEDRPAQIKGVLFQLLPRPVHSGQGQQIFYQLICALDLRLDIAQPAVLPNFPRQRLAVGRDHCQWGFQLMAGVPHELLLLVKGLLHRLGHPADQQHRSDAQQQKGRKAHQTGNHQELLGALEFKLTVQHYKKFPVGPLTHHKKLAAQSARICPHR
ncbi:hypothetical protein SDC9_130555 [bioreactor metagenome]|uniref:Uncharacterized protein n=1 Tax=bioreactor metagenome TaxID=1076179 RepID=A0A645D2W4_9ZZZZ